MKRIAVTGGTGMIGRRVVDALRARGDEVTVLSRSAPGTVHWADPTVRLYVPSPARAHSSATVR